VEHFVESEFHGWFDSLSKELKVKLDFLREIIDCPLELSNIPGGIGRIDSSNSQHNSSKWGEVRAVDGYIPEEMLFVDFYDACIAAQFTGIGFYTNWPSGRRGFHVDVRQDRTPEDPATWAARWVNDKNVYDVSIRELMHSEAEK